MNQTKELKSIRALANPDCPICHSTGVEYRADGEDDYSEDICECVNTKFQ